ncbi:MAG: cell wall-binding repeat-containing protein [Coriobacteriia bacterium]|nr:cell wall-binding repeat-containing protein [Coriobacteriia bacterium]
MSAQADPGNDISGAVPLSDGTYTDSLSFATDRADVYAVSIGAGKRIRVTLSADPTLLLADAYLFYPYATSIDVDPPLRGTMTDDAVETFTFDNTSASAATYSLAIVATQGAAAYTLVLETFDIPTLGSDDTIAGATQWLTGPIADTLNISTDVNDAVFMMLAAGERVTLSLSGDAGTDLDLYVYGPDPADLAVNVPIAYSNGPTSSESLVLDVKTAGAYYFETRTAAGSGAYTLQWERSLTPTVGDVVRLQGGNRYATAIALSEATFAAGSAKTVILATGEDFPDALAASPLAGAYECPLLLTAKASLSSGVLTELGRLGATKVIIVGGTSAVSSSVDTAIKASGRTVERLKGENRYATAVAIARRVVQKSGQSWTGTAFVTRGDAFADALSIGPIAFNKQYPVLLTDSGTLSSETRAFMDKYNVSDVVIAGGATAVSTGVEAAIKKLPSILCVERLSGSDRYATSKAIADWGIKHSLTSAVYLGVATGVNFPDGLGGGVVCGCRTGALLLTRPDALSGSVSTFVKSHTDDLIRVEVYGGEDAVTPAVVTSLDKLLP